MYFFPLIVFRDYKAKNLVDDKMLVRCYELFGQELLNLHLGQGLDIHWHKGGVNPDVQEYLQMYVRKTFFFLLSFWKVLFRLYQNAIHSLFLLIQCCTFEQYFFCSYSLIGVLTRLEFLLVFQHV